MLKTQEHVDLVQMFDREFKGRRLDKEGKSFWTMGRIYQDGQVNELFLAYRQGYAFGKALHQSHDVADATLPAATGGSPDRERP